jgi:hypothetical protein
MHIFEPQRDMAVTDLSAALLRALSHVKPTGPSCVTEWT